MGNNANIANGSLISVSGEGRQAGAGGGAGGESSIRGFYDYGLLDGVYGENGSNLIGARGGAGGFTQVPPLFQGSAGQTGGPLAFTNSAVELAPGTNEYARLFRSVAGGNGSSGQGNAGVADGGIERAYRRPDGSIEVGGPDKGVADFVLPVSGAGGRGGAGGGANISSTVAAQSGENGRNGGNGAAGLNGANATAIQSLPNPTVVSLRGGNGGGAGATGGDGLPGAAGGGGGGGGSFSTLAGAILAGSRGGDGGIAGLNGWGGQGGTGGGGGGGIQILVRGQLTVASGTVMTATGGNGLAGELGSSIGTEGGAGYAGTPGSSSAGGGGRGGNGGNGGRGGDGGMGVGGTGGTIQIVASNLTYAGTTSTRGGLAGDFITRSADGATYLHGYSGASANLSSSSYFGVRAAGANPYRSHASTFTLGGAPTDLSPNVPFIEGGAAPYGVLAEDGGVGRDVKAFTDLYGSSGRKRLGAVTRVGANFIAASTNNAAMTNDNQELILFTAFENGVAQPGLSAIDPSHTSSLDYIPSSPVRLRAGSGYLNDPTITPGAVAAGNMDTLPAYKTFAMYASGTQVVSASTQLYGNTRTFTGTPTPTVFAGVSIPGESTVFLEDRGLASIGFTARLSSGNSRAGFEQEIQTSGEYNDPGLSVINLRAGDTANLNGSVYGTGNAGTYVNGNVRIRTLKPQLSITEPGPLFTQVITSYNHVNVDESWNSSQAQIVTNGLAVGTTNRVGEVIFNPNYDDTIRTITFPVSSRIFGPSPKLLGTGTDGRTFTVPENLSGGPTVASFSLQNADVLSSIDNNWSSAIRFNPSLIRLSVLGYELVDPNGVFTITNLPTTFALNGNQSQLINLAFNPTAAGTYTATLRLLTDMNAPVGQAGDTFAITLSATTSVPEPATLSLVIGFAGLAMRRRHSPTPG